MAKMMTEQDVKDAIRQEKIDATLKIVPPIYDTESQIVEVMKSERRRYRINNTISKIVEWVLIIVAVTGFLYVVWENFLGLFNTYGMAVPVSIGIGIAIVMIFNFRKPK